MVRVFRTAATADRRANRPEPEKRVALHDDLEARTRPPRGPPRSGRRKPDHPGRGPRRPPGGPHAGPDTGRRSPGPRPDRGRALVGGRPDPAPLEREGPGVDP